MTRVPVIKNSLTEIIDSFDALGNVLFEEEYTEILNNFIERKMRFFPMFCLMYLFSFNNTHVLNIYEGIDQIVQNKGLYKSFKLEQVDFVSTGMTVTSMGEQYELLKLVTLNEKTNQREIFVIGFIQYQLDKWRKVLDVKDKIVHYDKAFDGFMNQKWNKDKRGSKMLEAYKVRLSQMAQRVDLGFSDMYIMEWIKNSKSDNVEKQEFFSPETKKKVEKLMKIREEVEEDDIIMDHGNPRLHSFKNDTLNTSSYNNQSSVDERETSKDNSYIENDNFFSITREKDDDGTFGKPV
mmetsp:Transcript_21801/g.19330  ORF Transcript_21801/g.19330 Transcript_21801/m.19330 type:complete len:294 (-) Transcript_21801:39-920(-)